ncbi:MAG: peroxide stress protein YaaA [Rhodobacteraceae bacterium]|nr:MAG: peroxide stress protein YaaA [Paracoccaceae bacterium]
MLVVVSPAKRLDWTDRPFAMTEPQFTAEADRLAGHARQLTLDRLKSLMGLSDNLARLNRDRFRSFSKMPTADVTRPALFAFAGDTYLGFDAPSMDDDARARSQSHLRILSGLYGVLRPMDAIQAYRLEMGSRLKTRRGNNLYDFWGDDIAKALNAAAEEAGTDTLINCASQEYFGAVSRRALRLRVITPVFFEVKNGTPSIVSFFAKKARGAMARFIIDQRVTSEEGLRDFDLGRYRFVAAEDDGARLIFSRNAEAARQAA